MATARTVISAAATLLAAGALAQPAASGGSFERIVATGAGNTP